eukprot:365765-Chlamydomonas_euryale.AAC.7
MSAVHVIPSDMYRVRGGIWYMSEKHVGGRGVAFHLGAAFRMAVTCVTRGAPDGGHSCNMWWSHLSRFAEVLKLEVKPERAEGQRPSLRSIRGPAQDGRRAQARWERLL